MSLIEILVIMGEFIAFFVTAFLSVAVSTVAGFGAWTIFHCIIISEF